MSTMVTMPVRVSPPPAAEGATISPTWATFTVTMPAKGARTMVSFSAAWAKRTPATATS